MWRRGRSLTCERGVLGEDVGGGGAQHDEDVDDAALRDPAHVRLWRLAGTLHVVQHLAKHGLFKHNPQTSVCVRVCEIGRAHV